MNPYAVLALVALVFAIAAYAALYNPKYSGELQADVTEVRQMIQKFQTGDMIAFDLPPENPVTEFIYREIQKTEQVTLSNGTVVNQTTTTVEQVPVSELEGQVTDRSSKQSKICLIGRQCDITGIVHIVDPITKKQVPPPYPYLMQILCDFRDDCVLRDIGTNDITDSDGRFKYTWVPRSNLNEGEYKAIITITSTYESNGKFINESLELPIQLLR